MAPKVTSSPWAKLTSPVVPKISESPMATMAMIRPKLDALGEVHEALQPRRCRPTAFGAPAQREQHDLLLIVTMTLSSSLRPRSEDPVGQRVGVDRDLVRARTGDRTAHLPSLVVGLPGVDFVAIGGLDHDLRTLDRDVLIGALSVS